MPYQGLWQIRPVPIETHILDDKEKIVARTADYEARFANPFIAAERGFVDDVIIPNNSRYRIIQAFEKLRSKRQQNPTKKFGNIPL